MYPPRPLPTSGVLVTESSYGYRKHSTVDPERQLGEIITRVAKRGGIVMFAAFAVGRAETLMLYLSRLRRHDERLRRSDRSGRPRCMANGAKACWRKSHPNTYRDPGDRHDDPGCTVPVVPPPAGDEPRYEARDAGGREEEEDDRPDPRAYGRGCMGHARQASLILPTTRGAML